MFRRDNQRADQGTSEATYVVESAGVLACPQVSEQDRPAITEVCTGACMVLSGGYRSPQRTDLDRHGRLRITGDPWRGRPTVINMSAVPDGGYAAILPKDLQHATVESALEHFGFGYTQMLQALDDCWNGPVDQARPSLGRAGDKI